MSEKTRQRLDAHHGGEHFHDLMLQGFDSKMIMLDGKPSDNQSSQSSDFGKSGGGDFDTEIPF